MKNSGLKPPWSSQIARGTAMQAPEANGTSRGCGTCDAGSPDSPAHAIPVKWMAPPDVLIVRPALGRHQSHPRRPAATVTERAPDRVAQARRGGGVGIEQQEQVAASRLSGLVARRCEPHVLGVAQQGRPRHDLGDGIRGPVRGRVVDDDELVASLQLVGQRSEGPGHRRAAVPRHHEHGQADRGGRLHGRKGIPRPRPSRPAVL